MNNKSARLQLLQYLHDYFDIKKKKVIKKGRKIKTTADVLADMGEFASLVKKEGVVLRKELQEKVTALQKKMDDAKLAAMMDELEQYSNANEEAILKKIISLFEAFEKEKDKTKKKEILIQIEDFVYGLTSDENLELSWDLFSFLQECFFIYYSHQDEKAEIEYGVNPKEDIQIDNSVMEKLNFLREVVAG